ncbi:MAG: hypothetical protein GF334_04620 [Candidatus Altiarchaeales archaeon]|nr:hypothetical protein [Candidatus Altiarchaeales archaeon]
MAEKQTQNPKKQPETIPDLKPVQKQPEVIGSHPLARTQDGRILNPTGVLFLNPRPAVIYDQPPIHFFLSTAYKDRLTRQLGRPLNNREEEAVDAGRVDLFTNEDGVVIRPDTTDPAKNLKAIEVLKKPPINIPDEQIHYCGAGNPKARSAVEKTGDVYRFYPLDIHDEAKVKKFIETSKTRLNTETTYLHERFKGSRYLTPDEVRGFTKDLDDWEKLVKRFAEVAKITRQPQPQQALYEQRKTGGTRQVDFLLVDENLQINPDTGKLYAEFKEIGEYVAKQTSWGEKQKRKTKNKLMKLLRNWMSENHPAFNQDNPQNPVWRNNTYLFLRGVGDEATYLKMESEYRGLVIPRPGGYIGEKTRHGDILLGAQKKTVNQLTDTEQTHIKTITESQSNTQTIVIDPEFHPQEQQPESVKTYQLTGELEGRVKVRQWSFTEKTRQETKDLLNEVLATHPRLEYAFVCDVAESQSRRDMLVHDTIHFGQPQRQVHITVLKEEGKHEQKLLTRQLKWGIPYWIHEGKNPEEALKLQREYLENVEDRIAALNKLGLHTPKTHIYHLHQQAGEERNQPVAHATREFIDGPATNRIAKEQYRNTDYVRRLLKQKGKAAARNLAARRTSFDDGDEIIAERTRKGYPKKIVLADPTATFREVEKPPATHAPLYACHLAQDLLKWEIMTENPGPQEKQTLAAQYYVGFTGETKKIRKKIRQNTGEYETYMDQRYEGRIPQQIPDWDMKSRWKKTIKSIAQTKPRTTQREIEQETEKHTEIFRHTLRGLKDEGEKILVLEAVTRAYAINWMPKGDLNQEKLGETLKADAQFTQLPAEERIKRLNLMRASSWIKRVGYEPEKIAQDAEEIRRKGGDARDFTEEVNIRRPKLHLSPHMAAEFYEAVNQAPEKYLLG